MPRIFKIGSYLVYFWSNENDPLEPVHVHVSKGYPDEHSTKIWITQSGKSLLCNNNSKIPPHVLRDIMDIILDKTTENVMAELEKTQKEFWNIARETGVMLNMFIKILG